MFNDIWLLTCERILGFEKESQCEKGFTVLKQVSCHYCQTPSFHHWNRILNQQLCQVEMRPQSQTLLWRSFVISRCSSFCPSHLSSVAAHLFVQVICLSHLSTKVKSHQIHHHDAGPGELSDSQWRCDKRQKTVSAKCFQVTSHDLHPIRSQVTQCSFFGLHKTWYYILILICSA